MRIPNWKPDPALRASILKSVSRVVDDGRYILGPEVAGFEAEFGEYLDADVVGVASGTDALEIALRAVGVRSGTAVATVSLTAVPTVAAIRRAGGEPLFVDIDPRTCLMDPVDLSRAIASERARRIAAIVPVHLYGQAAPMEGILFVARRAGIPVVEDCAQAAGVTYDGQRVGTFGDASAWSFYPTKPLGACGDAGAVASRRKDVVAFARLYREYGMAAPQLSQIEGANSRLDAFQAAILSDRLATLDLVLAERRRLASLYHKALADSAAIRIEHNFTRSSHSYYVYVVRVQRRPEVVRALAKEGIEARVHYPIPIHLMSPYADFNSGPLPETEKACSEVLSLPFWPGMKDEDVYEVARVLKEIL